MSITVLFFCGIFLVFKAEVNETDNEYDEDYTEVPFIDLSWLFENLFDDIGDASNTIYYVIKNEKQLII